MPTFSKFLLREIKKKNPPELHGPQYFTNIYRYLKAEAEQAAPGAFEFSTYTICDNTGYKISTAQRVVKELLDRQIITQIKSQGMKKFYKFEVQKV